MSGWHKMDTFPRDRIVEVTVWNDSHQHWLTPVLASWDNGIVELPASWSGYSMRWAYLRAMPDRPHSNEMKPRYF